MSLSRLWSSILNESDAALPAGATRRAKPHCGGFTGSLSNLPAALDPEKSGIEFVRIYDNSGFERRPDLVLESHRGTITRLATDFPEWLQRALAWTEYDLIERRADLKQAPHHGQ
jgi:hypothetical protein